VVRFTVIWHETPADPEAFDRHYREVHIPLARRMPGLRRYTLSRNVAPVRGEPPYCIAELDWDDAETMRRDMQSPEGRATGEDVKVMLEWSPRVQSLTYEVEDVTELAT
jgi:uncharacterized protein (TIGR02118 family)